MLFDVLSIRTQLAIVNGDIAAAMESNIGMVEWARRNSDEFELASQPRRSCRATCQQR